MLHKVYIYYLVKYIILLCQIYCITWSSILYYFLVITFLSLHQLLQSFQSSKDFSILFWQLICCPICCNAHGLSCVSQSILNRPLLLSSTKNNSDGRIFIGQAHKVIKGREVEVHLSNKFRQKLCPLQLYRHQTS